MQPGDLKGWVVCGTVCEDMHLKDLESIERVGCCIPVLGFYLVLHALRCQKCTLMDDSLIKNLWPVFKRSKKVKIVYDDYNDRKSTICDRALSGKFGGPTKGGCATHSVDFFVFQETNLIGRADFLCAQPQIGFKTSSDKLACFVIHCCVIKHI